MSDTKSQAAKDNLVAQLKESSVYKEYATAFQTATGLPLSLRSTASYEKMQRHNVNENPFCALMAKTNYSCKACLEVQKKLEKEACLEPKTMKCFAGLCDTAVPIRVGDNLIAFLHTGQVLLDQTEGAQFSNITKKIVRWGTEVDLKSLEEAYFHTRILSRSQYDAFVTLLTNFAQHLASISNAIAIKEEHVEPDSIVKAKSFINEKMGDAVSLADVADRINMSAHYFSKTFKKVTGMTFTEYLTRVRVEKAKNLLQNPNYRVSEIAFEVGFESLSQFNRSFKKVTGGSPTAYRQSSLESTTGVSV